jgi:hypothetical protein
MNWFMAKVWPVLVVMFMVMAIATFVTMCVVGIMTACDSPCQCGETRCDNNVIERCQDGEWEHFVDCTGQGDEWVCCWSEQWQGWVCVTKDMCEG